MMGIMTNSQIQFEQFLTTDVLVCANVKFWKFSVLLKIILSLSQEHKPTDSTWQQNDRMSS